MGTPGLRSILSLLVCAVCVAAGRTHAQTVGGRVVERETGTPVGSALVRLLDQQGGSAGAQVTLADGRFVLDAPDPGWYRLTVNALSYQLYHSDFFELHAGSRVERMIEVVPLQAYRLDTVVVEGRAVPWHLAEFYQRRSRGFGEFLTREEFAAWFPIEVTDLVRRLRGFTVVPDARQPGRYRIENVRISRRDLPFAQTYCPPLIFVNGAYVGDAEQIDLEMLPLPALDAVEAYGGPAQVPVEFGRLGAECGVLSFWSGAPRPGEGRAPSVAVGGHVGMRVGGDGVSQGRVGVQAVAVLLGVFELVPAANAILGVPADDAGGPTGWQALATVRFRPLGRASPWYIGLGGTVLRLREPPSSDPFGRGAMTGHDLALIGVALPAGRLRLFTELHVLDLSRAAEREVHLFTGVNFQPRRR